MLTPVVEKQVFDDVKILLGSTYNEKQVNTIIKMVSYQLLFKLKTLVQETIFIPEELSFIIVDVTVARFNRIGAEGMQSESVEGYSASYRDLFEEYQDDINQWAEQNGYSDGKKGKVRAF